MKRLFTIAIVLILATTFLYPQEPEQDRQTRNSEYRTLLGHDRQNGMYGAITGAYSEIGDKEAVLFGGRLEWISGHSFGVGLGVTGFINENHYDASLDRDVFLAGGYGGVYLEPILMPNYPVHLSFPVLLGVGGVSYISKATNLNHNTVEDSEAFLIAEPAAELELNISRHFRLALGLSYRLTTPFDVGKDEIPTVGSKALKGFSYMMTFKFGRF
jgi:hypothetical protein